MTMELSSLPEFESLYQDYAAKHISRYVAHEDLEALVLLAPVLSVAYADGKVDVRELLFVIEQMELMYRKEDLSPILTDESPAVSDEELAEVMEFIADFQEWENRLLELHKHYLQQDIEKQLLCVRLMTAIADSSHEDAKSAIQHVLDHSTVIKENISNTESERIKRVAEKLGLIGIPEIDAELSLLP
ncbi:MAG: hypothetical protein NZ108_03665 [Bacteroidia bacterium]|nr:hypothetical protein [Bacteroidia bacterium]